MIKNILFPIRYEDIVNKYCLEYQIDKTLCYAIIRSESGFNPNAKSHAGAIGLMQLLPSTAIFIANKMNLKYSTNEIDLTEPNTNIMLGCAYLNYLFTRFGSERAVICAYNAGEGNVQFWLATDPNLEVIPFKETLDYLNRVTFNIKVYKTII